MRAQFYSHFHLQIFVLPNCDCSGKDARLTSNWPFLLKRPLCLLLQGILRETSLTVIQTTSFSSSFYENKIKKYNESLVDHFSTENLNFMAVPCPYDNYCKTENGHCWWKDTLGMIRSCFSYSVAFDSAERKVHLLPWQPIQSVCFEWVWSPDW